MKDRLFYLPVAVLDGGSAPRGQRPRLPVSWDLPAGIPDRGAYLILLPPRRGAVRRGRTLGRIVSRRGPGATLGPPGKTCRAGSRGTCGSGKTLHWHIDYLRATAGRLTAPFPIRTADDLDARNSPGPWRKSPSSPSRASDPPICTCAGHLFRLGGAIRGAIRPSSPCSSTFANGPPPTGLSLSREAVSACIPVVITIRIHMTSLTRPLSAARRIPM